jgi:L-seryl-tRNA(Ser) seleniumtransferase
MPSRADAGVRAALLRQIPSVDDLLNRPPLARLSGQVSRSLVVETAREVLAELRREFASRSEADLTAPTAEAIEERIAAQVEQALAPSLKAVINATGVILHTNLGRAPISTRALAHLAEVAGQYSNLEYDLAGGARGKRDVHTARLTARLVGAEAALVVNNNAAAVFLVLNTLAKGGEVIVSRGELIEIGDGFRIPEIMAESGALLHEVGTTNRTRIGDYERAINERTRLLLRVHPSNFRIVGFSEHPALEDLVELARRHHLPLFEDLGSGCLTDLTAAGIEEPVAAASIAAGVSVVSYSGDKLLGGPQAGVIAGGLEVIARIRRNPMFRALRVDKLTIAALEATLATYLRGALDDIPSLRMIRLPAEEIGRRAEALAQRLRRELREEEAKLEVRDGASVIGGGSTPAQSLATRLLAITSARHSAARLEARLRRSEQFTPVVARIENDRLVVDLRTVFPEQEEALAAALTAALR